MLGQKLNKAMGVWPLAVWSGQVRSQDMGRQRVGGIGDRFDARVCCADAVIKSTSQPYDEADRHARTAEFRSARPRYRMSKWLYIRGTPKRQAHGARTALPHQPASICK